MARRAGAAAFGVTTGVTTEEGWERERGKDVLIGLSCTRDVQDAILADKDRGPDTQPPADCPASTTRR